MSLKNSPNIGVNETRTGHCEVPPASRCPAGKHGEPGRHQNITSKKSMKDENNIVISCYLQATKECK